MYDFKIDEKKLFEDCDALYAMAETGFSLFRTREYVRKSLADMGIEATDCGKCGLTALVGGGKTCVLLRADMDAIELDGKGAFHGCGHHMHTAMLLGAARILKENEASLRNTVKLMFQPAEEILEGAKDMIASGVLSSPAPDVAFMLHTATGVDLPTGTLIFPGGGEIAPGADYFEISVKGKGCHGSQPEKGIDPITAGAQVVCALSNIRSRELGVNHHAVLTIGSVHGGNAPNAIASKVTLGGTLRAFGKDTRDFVRKRLSDIVENICRAMRSEGRVSYTRTCPPFLCNNQVRERTLALATELMGKDKIMDASMISPMDSGAGSEDFAFVSEKIPTAMASIVAGSKKDGYVYPLHHPEVTFDKRALPVGSAFMAYMAMMY